MSKLLRTAHLLSPIAMSAGVATTQINAVPVASTPSLERKARTVATHNLVGPASAAFRSTRIYRLESGDIAFCGESNARNRMGGFVGVKPFYVRFDPKSPSNAPLNEQTEFLAETVCGAPARGQSIPIRQG